MKVIVLLCFALIACHQVAAVSKAEVMSLLQTDYAIDDVLDLFKNFRGGLASSLADLQADYSTTDPQLAAEVARTADLVSQKDAACDAIDATVSQGGAQAQTIKDNIQASQDTIDSNLQKAQAAADARCASNLLFISELGDRGEAIEFLGYLRTRIADPSFVDYLNNQGGAFLQLKTALATKQENEILSLIAKHHMLSMLQVKQDDSDYQGESDLGSELNAQVRTSDEIGTDYQDNNRGALQVQSIDDDNLTADQYVQLLLGYIDQLVSNLQGDVSKLQDVETQAVQAFIEYRRQLKDQNYVLQQYINNANAALANVEAVDENNEEAAAQCRAEVPPLEEGAQAAQDNKAAYEASFTQTQANLVEQIALFDQVIQVYTEEVVNVATDELKARADDYLDDETFNTTADFTARTDIPQNAN